MEVSLNIKQSLLKDIHFQRINIVIFETSVFKYILKGMNNENSKDTMDR